MAKAKAMHHDKMADSEKEAHLNKQGEHSHAHHAKMAKHHLSELHKMAKKGHKAK